MPCDDTLCPTEFAGVGMESNGDYIKRNRQTMSGQDAVRNPGWRAPKGGKVLVYFSTMDVDTSRPREITMSEPEGHRQNLGK
jgi:hypothetical protein